MYLSHIHILDNGFKFTIFICGHELKKYRILLSHICNSNDQLLYLNIINIILNEDVNIIYYDPWQNFQLIEFLNQFDDIRLVPLHGHDVRILKDLENSVKENNIIDINI